MRKGTEEYREYMREYMRERYNARRQEAIGILGGKCVVCGTTESLEIDHIRKELKTMSVNRLTCVGRERFLKELKNCQLLCKQHHLDKTRREMEVSHGGGASGKKNCKCDRCKAKKRLYMREYRRTTNIDTIRP